MQETRLTRSLVTLTSALTALSGLAFAGMAFVQLTSAEGITVQTDFLANAPLKGGGPMVSDGVEVIGGSVTGLVQHDPSLAQRAADLGLRLPWYLFGFVALLLLSRLLATALRDGPFTEAVPQRLRTLGWFVAVGGPVATFVTGWSQVFLESSMVPQVEGKPYFSLFSMPWEPMDNALPWSMLLTGLAAVIFGRIMREGVRMREDLEGTV